MRNYYNSQERDPVWLYNFQGKRGLFPKLQEPYEEPNRVMKKVIDIVYQIREIPNEICYISIVPFKRDSNKHELRKMKITEDEGAFGLVLNNPDQFRVNTNFHNFVYDLFR